jgi:hypothetical protein
VEVSGDSTDVQAGDNVFLVSRVLDAYGNQVAGKDVAFAVLNGAGNVVPNPQTSGANGLVTVTFTTDPVAGLNRVQGTINDGNPPHLETVEYIVETVHGPLDHYTIIPEKTLVKAGESMNVEVRAYDANDNPLTNDNTTVVVLGSSTGHARYGDATDPLVGGVYSTSVQDTAKENVTLTVDTQGGGPSASSEVVTVTNADPFRVIKIAGDTTGVQVGIRQRLWVEVQDFYENTVANEGVNFVISSNPGGTAELRDAVPDTTDGATSTDSGGRAWVDLLTADEAGLNRVDASILSGSPPDQKKTFDVTTIAGGIAYYTVTPATTSELAGVPIDITVRAFDINDNPVPDTGTSVTLSLVPPGGGTFAVNPVTLAGGIAATTLTHTAAYDVQVQATDGGANGISPSITIQPNLPAGTITALAVPDTITANGASTSLITSSAITDTYGNTVGTGTKITIAASAGVIISPDQDGGTPGNQQITNPSGQIVFQLRSDTSPGMSIVSMTSVSGTAAGNVSVYFAQPPVINCLTQPIPNNVVAGDFVAFKVYVLNTSATGVNLSSSTTFEFSDTGETFIATLASPIHIAPVSADTLHFTSTQVDVNMDPGSYRPVLELSGTDLHGSPFSGTCLLQSNSLTVSAIQITAISAPAVVVKGDTKNVTVTVKNLGPITATIESVSLDFSLGSYSFGASPDLPATILPGATGDIRVPVTIQTFSNIGFSTIDAVVSGTVNGIAVSDGSLAPYLPLPQWEIKAGADLDYVSGSLIEMTVSQDQDHSFSLELTNNGDATVTLDPLLTELSFTDGVETYTALLAQSTAIASGATQRVAFLVERVPLTFSPGPWDVDILCRGLENGAPFTETVRTSDGGDFLNVVTPASLNPVTPSLNPDLVSRLTDVFFEVTFQNLGGASIILDTDSTRISFGSVIVDARLDAALAAYDSPLDPGGSTTIGTASTTLKFLAQTVTVADGDYLPQVRIVGLENGVPYRQTFSLGDTVHVQDAPDVSITAITPSQPNFTADQVPGITLRMDVSNTGQATVRFDSARVQFILGGENRTGQFTITPPASFNGGINLPTGQDYITFPVSDNLGNAMSTGNMTIEGTLWVTDLAGPTQIIADTDLGGKGSLLVQSPAVLVIRSITSSQDPVSAGQSKQFKLWMAVENTGRSDVNVALHRDSTNLSFTAPDDWVWTIQPTLAGGGRTLEGNAIDTVVFNVQTAGTLPDLIDIDGLVEAVEQNSNRHVTDDTGDAGSGSILVQSEAQINITGVTASRPTITSGSGADWIIDIDVSNVGESDVALTLPESLIITLQNEIGGTVYVKPSALDGGGPVLYGETSGTLTVLVDQTGTFSSFGSKNINVRLAGEEVNSDRPLDGTGSGGVIVQVQPDVDYVFASLEPTTVSSGSIVPFQVQLFNSGGLDGATVRLDRNLTRLRFGTAPDDFAAPLAASSVDSLPGAVFDTLLFEATWVDPLIPTGTLDVRLDLHWEENGATDSKLINLPGALTIQDAPRLNIVEIRPSQSTVTVNQAAGTWHVTMVLENNGDADVDLNLADTATKLTLRSLGDVNVTGEYEFVQPTGLESIGGTVLPGGGARDELIFDVTTTGTTEGLIIISGNVSGKDVFSPDSVFDDTSDGGFGNVTVQSAAGLEVLSITPQQPTATANQLTSFKVWMAVRNNGASAVRMALHADSTKLTFSQPVGWLWDVEALLASEGDILAGNSIDTVVFNIQRVGSVTETIRIDGQAQGFEMNTNSFLQDNTADAGWGSILVQAPAVLVINSVIPERAFVTEGSDVEWTISVQVTNSGGSDLSLILPDSAAATIQADISGSTIEKPFQLEGGGTLLPKDQPGVLVFTVTNTGLFSSFGLKNINVRIVGTELNSKRRVPATGSGALTIQRVPDPFFVDNTLLPPSGTRGEEVQYQITIENPIADGATIVLDRGTSKLWFASSQFEAFMDPSSPNSIAAQESLTIVFEQTDIDPLIAIGFYDVFVDLFWEENGNSGSKQILLSDQIEVQPPSELQITQIVAQQEEVTAGQSQPLGVWDAWMVVANNGVAPIVIDLLAPATMLKFEHLVQGDVTTEYTVNPPAWLTPIPGDTLRGGDSGTLVFQVTQTGTTTGTVLISGNVKGRDVNTGDPVEDDGGSETITVQSEGNLVFDNITPSQPTVTETQTASWFARVTLDNSGESDLNIDLAACRLTFSGGIGWSYIRPPTLEGGGSILEGNSSDVLIFDVDNTATAGVWGIDAYVDATEINSNRMEVDSTGTSGFGSILVQTKPRLRVTSTTITAPRAPEVNTDQPFGVEVSIVNNGQAQAESVFFHISNTGGSTLEPPTNHVVANLNGAGASVLDTFAVTAPGLPGTDTFSMIIDGAIDANSMQSDLVTIESPDPPADGFDTAFIQIPAELEIVSLIPSQNQITRDQPTPWYVTVNLRDIGQADLQLVPPTEDDIRFFIGGLQQNDYIVNAPTSLVTGSNWIVPGDSSDALVFEVSSSGSTPGRLDIRVDLTAIDMNDPAAGFLAAQRDTFITVEEASGLFIESTIALVSNKQPNPPLAFVNTQQQYVMEVVVRNTGEAVDSVKVLLMSNGFSDPDTTDVSGQYQPIATDASATFAFDVVAGPTSNPFETFTAWIDSAKSVNTNLQVEPSAPIDEEEFVATQTPADLNLSLNITWPPGAVDGEVSTSQEFEVTAVVTNLGQAATDSSGNVRLITGFVLHPSTPDPQRSYYAGEQVTWRLIAPGTPAAGQSIVSAIEDTLTDKNIAAPAMISQDTSAVTVDVVPAGILQNPVISYILPQGAMDGVLSTDQEFLVEVKIQTTSQTQGIFATIGLPAGFVSIGSTQKSLGNGIDGVKVTTFQVRASPFATSDNIGVTFSATDKNTGLDLPDAVGSEPVEVVAKTRLRLSADIVAPPEALDSTVTIGSSFSIEAVVTNDGTAGISTQPSDPTPVLKLNTPGRYSVNPDSVHQRFALNTPVTWTVTAPSAPSGPVGISVVIDTIPDDENSNELAEVAFGQVTIPVQTEGAVMEVQDVTAKLGFDTKVVPAGATDIGLFAVEIKNPRSNLDEPPAQIDTVYITVLDRDDRPLSNPGAALASLTLDIDGERLVIQQPSENPIVLNVAGMGGVAYVQSRDSTNLAFSVGITSIPSVGEIRLAIRSGDDIVVSDSASSQQLGVVDKETGQPIDDGIKSHPLVILSNEFGDYVHNYPNPFRAGSEKTRIAYFLSSQSDVTIKIYSMTGSLVYEKMYARGDPHTQPGPREAEWDGRNMKGETVRNGIYICKLVAGSNSATFRIAVAK